MLHVCMLAARVTRMYNMHMHIYAWIVNSLDTSRPREYNTLDIDIIRFNDHGKPQPKGLAHFNSLNTQSYLTLVVQNKDHST